MNYISHLNSLINALKRESLIFFSNHNKLTKHQLSLLKQKIDLILHAVSLEVSNLKSNVLPKKLELAKQKNASRTLTNNILSLQSSLKKARAALTKNIKFLQKQNSTFTVSEISHTDLINVSLRISKQNSFPTNYPLGFSLPFSFLLPYPDENFEMTQSVLKFNLAHRLLQPEVEPRGGIIKKGTLVKVTYPQVDNDVFFKYSLDSSVIPSYFSGSLYKSDLKIIIHRNCNLNVVSCKFGCRDSDVLSVGFTVSQEEKEMTYKTLTSERNDNLIVKPVTFIKKGEISGIHFSDADSPHYTERNSDYRNSAYSVNRNSVYSKNDDDDPI